MANTVIQLKHSTLTGNVPSSLANGEISINNRDGKFFYSTPAGVVTTHYPYLGPSGLNQEIQFNDSGVLGSDSGLTYNKTTDVLTVVGGAIVGGVNVTPQIQLAFTQANTPSHVANSAASYANSSFLVANSAASYANSAFGKANSAFLAANTPSYTANSAASYANSAFARANNSLDANNGGTVTGTITATSFITTGSYGNITGANTIYANNFVANTGFIQFSDGSKQYTANAGGGGDGTDAWARGQANAAFIQANAAFTQANTGGSAVDGWARGQANAAFSTANNAQSTASSAQSTADSAYNTYDIASIYTPNNSTTVSATGRSDTVNLVGTAGIYIFSDTATKTITVAGGIQSLPGAQGMTVDYGYVSEAVYYAIDYGTL